jgi:hypothetical protein
MSGEVKIATKMSSFIKLRIIDYELCVSEYGLCLPPPPPQPYDRFGFSSGAFKKTLLATPKNNPFHIVLSTYRHTRLLHPTTHKHRKRLEHLMQSAWAAAAFYYVTYTCQKLYSRLPSCWTVCIVSLIKNLFVCCGEIFKWFRCMKLSYDRKNSCSSHAA